MGAHTNSDDPTRYVPDDELASGRRAIRSSGSAPSWNAPVCGTTLATTGALAAVEARLERIIDAALAREVDPASALDHITATPDARAAAQRAEIVARTRTPSAPRPSTEGVSWRA